MKLVDANVLIYAVDEKSARHEGACAWLETALSGAETVALPWASLLAFVRLSTRAVVFENPLTADEALDVVDGWLAQPNVVVPNPGRRHATLLRELLDAVGTGGNLVTDAHLAALAIEHGAELFSFDADFSRFPAVNWVDPLNL